MHILTNVAGRSVNGIVQKLDWSNSVKILFKQRSEQVLKLSRRRKTQQLQFRGNRVLKHSLGSTTHNAS